LQHPQDAFKTRPVRCPWTAPLILPEPRLGK
jgi:hypothetical protein